mgnify:FL=1
MDIKEYIKSQIGVYGAWKSAKEISTFKGGGQAFVFYPQSVEKAVELIGVLREENVTFSMLGSGSNTLVCDGNCRQVLVCLKGLCGVKIEGEKVVCEGGASVAKITFEGRKRGLGGLEFLSGVPCTLGGALKMNAGAFSSQIGDYATKIDILNLDCANCDKNRTQNRIREVSVNSKDLAYRKGVDGIVLKAELKLAKKSGEQSVNEAREYLRKRQEKQPSLPSLGSVFKNGKIPSGKLIDDCGLKGVKIGGAQVSQKHANFIVNVGGASAKDYLTLASLCKKEVFEKFGILLEEEFVTIE